MTIHFKIHYNTYPGQTVYITGSSKEFGKWDTKSALTLKYSKRGMWGVTIKIPKKQTLLEYKYVVMDHFDSVVWESGINRIIDLKSFISNTELIIHDTWRNENSELTVFNTKAFTDVLMKPTETEVIPADYNNRQIELRVRLPRMGRHHRACLLGEEKILGNWDSKKPVLMYYNSEEHYWYCRIHFNQNLIHTKYKFGIYDINNKEAVTLEEGKNRVLEIDEDINKNSMYLIVGEQFHYPLGNWKASGVSVPVFSLRSDDGFGVGDFNDLFSLADWAADVGLKMIQLLPINETITDHGWLDSYPYKSISVIALHPIYLNLDKLGQLKDKKLLKTYREHKQRLNEGDRVIFPEVLALKSAYYKLIFDQEKKSFFKLPEYKLFFKSNKEWLVPYAAYAYLRDKYKDANFRNWKTNSKFNKAKIEELTNPDNAHWDDIAVHYFIQFHLDKQLKEAVSYAHDKGIILKGDIPIGISPNSIEAWTEPHLFNLNGQAGAPPDDFAVKGQNWGFPTYRWDKIAAEKFRWWKQRLEKMAEYFDAYRIDHILGFFRIWEIPTHAVEGILGHFSPALPLTANEIESYGIVFDYNRMVNPYLPHHVINNSFLDKTEQVIEEFFEPESHHYYVFKDAFNTQQKLNEYFLEGIVEEDLDEENKVLRNKLFDLVANVLFIQSGENEWHPRISMHSTASYNDLSSDQKQVLDKLYIDYFYKRHTEFWHTKGLEKLPEVIETGNMLVCGEDLGMVPTCVPPVMKQLNILSLEIQRMSKNPKKKYAHPADAPYLSVCTTSTHDMPTIRGWWEENREDIQDFFYHELGNYGEAPFFAEPWVCEQIVNQHLHSPAMWTTFPIQDLIAISGDLRWNNTREEQINEPENVRHHWRFRMHQSLNELQHADEFNESLKLLIKESGRNSDY